MIRIVFILIAAVQLSCVQKRTDISRIELDSTEEYFIPKENEIFDMSWVKEPNDTIRANLDVDINGMESDKILLCNATLQNDTLKIVVHRLSSYLYNEYSIFITKQNYFVKYRRLVDVLPEEVIVPINTRLKLNTFNFKKGKEVRGYTEFKGHCKKPCHDTDVFVRGNFKCTIE